MAIKHRIRLILMVLAKLLAFSREFQMITSVRIYQGKNSWAVASKDVPVFGIGKTLPDAVEHWNQAIDAYWRNIDKGLTALDAGNFVTLAELSSILDDDDDEEAAAAG